MDKLEKALEKARGERGGAITFALPSASHRKPGNGKPADIVLPRARRVLEIPEQNLDTYRILAHRTRNRQADVFRILRTQVLQMMRQSGLRTLAITSPNYGDGKTTVAINLAISMSLDLKQTVLLADLDLRKPGVSTYLGINAEAGLTDHILENRPASDCLLRTSFERLVVLPSGRARDNSSELLGSSKMTVFAQELKQRYDDRIIIYDMPPILAQDDSLAFLPNIDAVLMIVREGMTKVDDIKQSMAALGAANVLGVVLNNSGKNKPLAMAEAA